MPYLCMRHDFRAPGVRSRVGAGDLRGRARAVRVGRSQRLRPARAVRAPRHRRRLAAVAADDGGRRARPDRTRPGDGERGDPAAARPGAHRRADRGARQRRARPAVGRGGRGLPRRGVRDGRRRPRGARARSSRSTSSVMLRAWSGEPFEWQGRTRDRHAEAGDRSRTRWCSSAAECPRRRGGRPGCASRCCR